jgi:hypothetical protein
MTTHWLHRTSLSLVGLGLTLGFSGCKSNPTAPAPIVDGSAATDPTDPADVNMAPVNGVAPAYTSQQPARVLAQRSQAPQQASGEQYGGQYPDQQPGYDQNYDQAYDQDQAAVDAGQMAIYADQAPPPLPEYQQPELTEPGYEWTPGYWNYAPSGYYWVPGVWVAPPFVGALWTPSYWAYSGNRYRLHHGFWGSHIGFYGGINYGFGYTGSGYHGGYWQGNNFYYNRQVNRVNVSVVRNVYEHNVTVVNNTRISYNGPHGVEARPSAVDVAVYHERVVPPMQVQVQHMQQAAQNHQQFYAANHGRPAEAALPVRLPADRTPPPAIRPAPEVVRQQVQPPNPGRPGVPNQPAGNPRVDAGQQAQQQRARDQETQREQQQMTLRDEQMKRQQQGGQHAPGLNQPQPQQPVAPQVRPQPQAHPEQPVRPQPQARPEAQPQPQVHPQPEARPQPRPGPAPMATQPRPQPEARPQPETRPQPQPRPAPQQPQPRPQPAPQAKPEPQPRPAPHPPEPPKEEHPRH